MENHEHLLIAAQAAFPELWPSEEPKDPSTRAGLAIARQQAMDRAGNAIAAFEASVAGDEEGDPAVMGDLAIEMPEGAAMLLQTLVTIAYIDEEGRTAYVVRTMGEGMRSSWLGMCVLTQDYLLKLPALPPRDD